MSTEQWTFDPDRSEVWTDRPTRENTRICAVMNDKHGPLLASAPALAAENARLRAALEAIADAACGNPSRARGAEIVRMATAALAREGEG